MFFRSRVSTREKLSPLVHAAGATLTRLTRYQSSSPRSWIVADTTRISPGLRVPIWVGMLPKFGSNPSGGIAFGVTVMAAEPETPSALAEMATGPPASFPVTRPAGDTDAIASLADDQVKGRPATALPKRSSAAAVRDSVAS